MQPEKPCLLEDMIEAAKQFLHRAESAIQEIVLCLSTSETKVVHISAQADCPIAKDSSAIGY